MDVARYPFLGSESFDARKPSLMFKVHVISLMMYEIIPNFIMKLACFTRCWILLTAGSTVQKRATKSDTSGHCLQYTGRVFIFKFTKLIQTQCTSLTRTHHLVVHEEKIMQQCCCFEDTTCVLTEAFPSAHNKNCSTCQQQTSQATRKRPLFFIYCKIKKTL